jgi:hypothetical protein
MPIAVDIHVMPGRRTMSVRFAALAALATGDGPSLSCLCWLVQSSVRISRRTRVP